MPSPAKKQQRTGRSQSPSPAERAQSSDDSLTYADDLESLAKLAVEGSLPKQGTVLSALDLSSKMKENITTVLVENENVRRYTLTLKRNDGRNVYRRCEKCADVKKAAMKDGVPGAAQWEVPKWNTNLGEFDGVDRLPAHFPDCTDIPLDEAIVKQVDREARRRGRGARPWRRRWHRIQRSSVRCWRARPPMFGRPETTR